MNPVNLWLLVGETTNDLHNVLVWNAGKSLSAKNS